MKRDGTGFRQRTGWEIPGAQAPDHAKYHLFPANLNGDRLADLLLLSDDPATSGLILRTALGTANGFAFNTATQARLANRSLYHSTVLPVVGDFNGDGLTDLSIMLSNEPSQNDFDILVTRFVSDGAGGMSEPTSTVPFRGSCPTDGRMCAYPDLFTFWRSGDVNGDGLTDLMSAFPGNFGCGSICGAGSCTPNSFATMLSIITELDGTSRGPLRTVRSGARRSTSMVLAFTLSSISRVQRLQRLATLTGMGVRIGCSSMTHSASRNSARHSRVATATS